MGGNIMKRTYIKPEIRMEHFTLSQSIASCTGVTGGGSTLGKPSHWDKSTCGWDLGGYIVWTEPNSCPDEQASPDEVIDGVCYNNPSGHVVAFSS